MQGILSRKLQPSCNIHLTDLAHNGPSTSSRIFLFSVCLAFDCFSVLCRVSLPIHVYGPIASVQIPLPAVPRTPGVLGGTLHEIQCRARTAMQPNAHPHPRA